jgi:4-hydroxybenzoate polyprenyltransferase
MILQESTEQTGPRSGSGGIIALIEAMRLPHWLKNTFVIAPIIFAGAFGQWQAWWRCLLAVGSFCLLSSAVYLINDICDRQADRAHPDKCNRPIASGRLSTWVALVAAVLLTVAGMALAAGPTVLCPQSGQPLGGWGLVAWAGAYLVLNLLYSVWLKHCVIVDVILVAISFVLRAMAGAAAIAVPISPWLVVCTFSLCLFVALSKRRAELTQLSPTVAGASRKVHLDYNDAGELDRMLTISAALAIITYSLYCLAPRTVGHVGSAQMVWTIPLVIYGVFRYDRASRRTKTGDVVQVFLADKVLWLIGAVFVAVSLLVIRYGAHPAVKTILDV